MSEQLPEQPFMSHLLELRDRLMRSVLAVLVLLLALFPFGNDIYTFVAEPLMKVLPEGASMIATKVASPFLTPFKLSLVTAVFLAMPYLLYQLWSFIAPGLYQHEKRLALPLLASSIVLFYLGAAFAYVVVFPLVFAFLTSTAPEGVLVMTDISEYLDFVLTLFFAFGIAFQVPVATIILVLAGITTPEKLAAKRPYVIVVAFVVGMLLTPPDVISQTLLAVPMWLLFELGVFLSRLVVRQRAEREASEEVSDEPAMAMAGAAAAHSTATSAEDDYRPMTDEEMEAELDALDDDDDDEVVAEEEPGSGDGGDKEEPATPETFTPDAVDEKLEQVMRLREEERFDEARRLLYEVLVEGNELQVKVARNILDQLDG
ncbi:MAG: twin-arginine translocase subunit TatC [Gammaproteobacteria bacterium]|nr:MAG: twin-arginine translocase subunit TatC [Gammaproteobacteria bacterium]